MQPQGCAGHSRNLCLLLHCDQLVARLRVHPAGGHPPFLLRVAADGLNHAAAEQAVDGTVEGLGIDGRVVWRGRGRPGRRQAIQQWQPPRRPLCRCGSCSRPAAPAALPPPGTAGRERRKAGACCSAVSGRAAAGGPVWSAPKAAADLHFGRARLEGRNWSDCKVSRLPMSPFQPPPPAWRSALRMKS